MLTLTETAQDVVRQLVETENAPEGSGLRIAAEPTAGGDASLSLELAAGPAEGDEVVAEGVARVFLEPTAASLLGDKVLDATDHDDHVHFTVAEQGMAPSDNGAGPAEH